MNIIVRALYKYEFEINFEIGLNTKRKKTKTNDVFTFYVGVDIALFFFMTACSPNFLSFLSQPQHIQPLFCAHLLYFLFFSSFTFFYTVFRSRD